MKDEDWTDVPTGDRSPEEEQAGYTLADLRTVAVPAAVLVTLVVVAILAVHLIREREHWEPLDDLELSGSFRLQGPYDADLAPYGPHSRAVNITLRERDHLVLSFFTGGLETGIQVRVQSPLHPVGGGGPEVLASSEGTDGTIDLIANANGAFQVYFWHPGSARPPGDGDDEALHYPVDVTYDLRIERAMRPS